MSCVSAEITPIDIRLTRIVGTGAGGVADRGGLYLCVTDEQGRIGYGEAARIPGDRSFPTLETLATELRDWGLVACGADIDELLATIDSHRLCGASRFAVHTALSDLAAQSAALPLAQWLAPDAASTVLTNALVAAPTPAAVHAEVGAQASKGFRAIKLKVGVGDITTDITRIIAASEAAGSDVEYASMPTGRGASRTRCVLWGELASID